MFGHRLTLCCWWTIVVWILNADIIGLALNSFTLKLLTLHLGSFLDITSLTRVIEIDYFNYKNKLVIFSAVDGTLGSI